ncbi:MAG: VWA-like domain-containing protein [Schaedlerella sp.]|nr:VWA-like domain-containing protein [Schaedlerella sp.]
MSNSNYTEEELSLLAERFQELGSQILGTARDELYMGMRFLDVALSSFSYQMDTTVSPLGTDGAVMYFHPQELGGLYRQNRILVNRGYLHMVFHCIFHHLWKKGYNRQQNQTNEGEMLLWDLSCDIAVEYLIDANFHRSVRYSRSLLRRETYRKLESENKTLHVERVFKILQKWNLDEKQIAKLTAEFYVDDHKYWLSENSQNTNQQLQRKWKEINESMETNLETFSKEASVQSGDFLEQIKIENRERQDYKEFLRKFSVFREEVGVDVDTFDYTFYSYGLQLYGNMPLIEPLETKEVKKVAEFVIVIDTSMSCSGKLVKKFLEETYGILMEQNTFFKKVNIHILQCDETVQSDVKIINQEELKDYMETLDLYGEGGTDFRPAFEYVQNLLDAGEFENLRGLLYFTDGYGIYPAKMPPYQTAFVFMQEDYNDTEVPAWALKLIVEDTEDDYK